MVLDDEEKFIGKRVAAWRPSYLFMYNSRFYDFVLQNAPEISCSDAFCKSEEIYYVLSISFINLSISLSIAQTGRASITIGTARTAITVPPTPITAEDISFCLFVFPIAVTFYLFTIL